MLTNQNTSKPCGSINTVWELRTYDVWGDARDGYEVNNVFSAGEVELRIPQTRQSIGVESQEFVSAYPSERQIKRAFGVHCRINTDRDDLTVYVERARDGFPIGEMYCVSHESLSPVRPMSRRRIQSIQHAAARTVTLGAGEIDRR